MKPSNTSPNPARDAALLTIAQDCLNLETLDTRNRDALDFKEQSVWEIKMALEAAYAAGARSVFAAQEGGAR